jgi:hypothetical protein
MSVQFHPLRLVPESKFVEGKDVEEVAEGEEAAIAKAVAEKDAKYHDDADFPKDLDEFEARRAGEILKPKP